MSAYQPCAKGDRDAVRIDLTTRSIGRTLLHAVSPAGHSPTGGKGGVAAK
jgi:hypothetical protein